MSSYVIGDIQGCYSELTGLLDRLDFDARVDQIWLVGDLVNRGPDSLGVLRLVKSLGDSAKVVLGNHDLHLLAIYYAGHTPRPSDTLTAVLEAPDVEELMAWLVLQPLFYRDTQLNACMSHAGVPHIWSIDQTEEYAGELQRYIQQNLCEYFLHMYGNFANPWHEDLQGMERMRCITNYLARMRYIRADGTLDFSCKEAPGAQPDGFKPWYTLRDSIYKPAQTSNTQASKYQASKYQASHEKASDIFFGHWASLAGVVNADGIYALDTACVWGDSLTAQCIESGKRTSFNSGS
ncbi:MAG: symmetrical bis(5'-nucleosyl)-tetraphosphatase [Pseudomonadales bacterium]|nr:symmetrical bis(5'-nucleosyl)-tetraphosphatase [Pseudomonadales bacterium]